MAHSLPGDLSKSQRVEHKSVGPSQAAIKRYGDVLLIDLELVDADTEIPPLSSITPTGSTHHKANRAAIDKAKGSGVHNVLRNTWTPPEREPKHAVGEERRKAPVQWDGWND